MLQRSTYDRPDLFLIPHPFPNSHFPQLQNDDETDAKPNSPTAALMR